MFVVVSSWWEAAVPARDRLKRAIRKLHGYHSVWLRSEPVHEIFEDETVWDGTVEVFELRGHPSATLCYAWETPPVGGCKSRFYAVLRAWPVDSAAAAVRASIIQDRKNGRL